MAIAGQFSTLVNKQPMVESRRMLHKEIYSVDPSLMDRSSLPGGAKTGPQDARIRQRQDEIEKMQLESHRKSQNETPIEATVFRQNGAKGGVERSQLAAGGPIASITRKDELGAGMPTAL